MSVKKKESKLAQGVRQVQAQHAESQPVEPVEPVATDESVAKPAANKVKPSSTLHPSRVWPD